MKRLFLLLLIALFVGGITIFTPTASARDEEECHAALNQCDTDFSDFDGRTRCYRELMEHAVDWFNTCNSTDVYGHMRYADSWPYQNLPENFSFECFECIAWIETHRPQDRDTLRQTRCVDSERVCAEEHLSALTAVENAGPDDPPPPPLEPMSCSECEAYVRNQMAPAQGHAGDEEWIAGQLFNTCETPEDDGDQRCFANPANPDDDRNPPVGNPGATGLATLLGYLNRCVFPATAFCGATQGGGLPGYISEIKTIGSALFGGLAVLKIIFGGVLYATAAGNPQKISEAKSHIYYALIGMALISGMNIILAVLGVS